VGNIRMFYLCSVLRYRKLAVSAQPTAGTVVFIELKLGSAPNKLVFLFTLVERYY
jgi:hypothetical protein